MASVIWVDQLEEDSVFANIKMEGHAIRSVRCPDRHIIAKGSVLEGWVGK